MEVNCIKCYTHIKEQDSTVAIVPTAVEIEVSVLLNFVLLCCRVLQRAPKLHLLTLQMQSKSCNTHADEG